jgi:hypothetical protein
MDGTGEHHGILCVLNGKITNKKHRSVKNMTNWYAERAFAYNVRPETRSNVGLI